MANGTHFIYVAPNNSDCKELADFICNGTNDAQQINSAIAAAKEGFEIVLLKGKFNISEPININKSDLTIRGAGYGTVVEQVEKTGSTTSIIFNITSERIKIKDMMIVDVDVDYPQYIIRSQGTVNECDFKRLFMILKSTKTNIDSYIDLSGFGMRFYDCRVYYYASVPGKMTINIVGDYAIISGMINTGNSQIKINFSNNSYYTFANHKTDLYINGVKK